MANQFREDKLPIDFKPEYKPNNRLLSTFGLLLVGIDTNPKPPFNANMPRQGPGVLYDFAWIAVSTR